MKLKLLNTGHFSNLTNFDIIKILGIKDSNQIYNIIGLNLSHKWF
ncbi:hypothetical protein [Candidatus Karelsulcia muelleri]